MKTVTVRQIYEARPALQRLYDAPELDARAAYAICQLADAHNEVERQRHKLLQYYGLDGDGDVDESARADFQAEFEALLDQVWSLSGAEIPFDGIAGAHIAPAELSGLTPFLVGVEADEA